MDLYPLTFEPIYMPKVWGDRKLLGLGRPVPEGPAVGESWELADVPAPTPARSIVSNGPLAGRTLHDLIGQLGEQLIGHVPLAETGDFPMLFKYLDAAANLSVQVHPDEDYAATHPGVTVQTESWYVVAADPGSVIYKGVQPQVSADEFRAAIDAGAVANLLIEVPAIPGQAHHIPAGCCHALGAGVLVAEAQTCGNTTFRAHDWNRTDREIHVEQAMQCIQFGPAGENHAERRTKIENADTCVTRVIGCEQYRIEEMKLAAGYTQSVATAEPIVWMVIDGHAKLLCDHVRGEDVSLKALSTVLIPPALPDMHLVVEEDVTLLAISFPQALANVIA